MQQLYIRIYRRIYIFTKCSFAGSVNWCFWLSVVSFLTLCYWHMDTVWIRLPLADIICKLQVLALSLWLIWRRTHCIARIQHDYLIIYQFPFKTILLLEDVSAIWFDDNSLRIEIKNGNELYRYYLFCVYPRIKQDIALQKCVVML